MRDRSIRHAGVARASHLGSKAHSRSDIPLGCGSISSGKVVAIAVVPPSESAGAGKRGRGSRGRQNRQDTERKAAPIQVKVQLSIDISLPASDLQCPVCLDTIRDCTVVGGCLHRFCNDCISRSLRSSKLECPSCRIHIPSRRSLRSDERFDAIVQLLHPSTLENATTKTKSDATAPTTKGARSPATDLGLLKHELQQYRRLHRERTAAIRAAASAFILPMSPREALTSVKREVDIAHVNSEGSYHNVFAEATAGAHGSDPTYGLDVDGTVPMRVDDVSGEVGLVLRHVPDVLRYNDIVGCIKEEPLLDLLRTSIDYSLHRPYLVVPAKAKLPDLRIFIKKMLSQVNKHVETSQISFALLDQANKATVFTDRDDASTIAHLCRTRWDKNCAFCIIYSIKQT